MAEFNAVVPEIAVYHRAGGVLLIKIRTPTAGTTGGTVGMIAGTEAAVQAA